MAQSMTDQRAMRAGPAENGLQELQFPAAPGLGRGELGGTIKIILLVQPRAFPRRKPGFRGVGVPRASGVDESRIPGAISERGVAGSAKCKRGRSVPRIRVEGRYSNTENLGAGSRGVGPAHRSSHDSQLAVRSAAPASRLRAA